MMILIIGVLLFFAGRAIHQAFSHLEEGLDSLKFIEYNDDCE